jgi:hypothetical protein
MLSVNDDGSVRNMLAKILGAFWIFDGLLQFQPQMFGENFVTNILVPNLSDQPAFLHTIVERGIQAWSTNMVVTNTLAALLQVAIGVLLFFPLSGRSAKFGLWISIIWGIIVWLCGEGAGLLFTGNASFYTGAPGAVLLYILLATYLLMPEKFKTAWLPKIAGWLLVAGAALQLQPVFWTADGVKGSLMTPMMEQVHLLSGAPTYVAGLLSIDPILGNALLVLIPLVTGFALILKPNRITGGIALVFLFLVWWWGQDFGGLSTLIVGTSTDPNTAPLMTLMLVPIFTHQKFPGREEPN